MDIRKAQNLLRKYQSDTLRTTKGTKQTIVQEKPFQS